MAVNKDQLSEIEELRSIKSETLRSTVPELENILYQPFEVLDHGFVRVIDYMGDDSAIVQSARVSYGKGTKQISNDKGSVNVSDRRQLSQLASNLRSIKGIDMVEREVNKSK